jgi:hypothetical protein
LVEHQPSKLRVAGSIPVSRSVGSYRCSGARRSLTVFYAHVAQEVEHLLGKEEVTSSSLVVGSFKSHSLA